MGIPIVLDGLTRTYRDGARTHTVLDAVDLSIAAGEFVSVMGPSGSGKSTMLNLIAGLDTPTRGKVLIAGDDIGQLSDDQRSDLRLQKIGLVFQAFNLLPTFTAEENVLWPLEFLGLPHADIRRRTDAALAQVGLAASLRGRRPGELSGGEQQRVAIARALVAEPQVLLADEPTGNLDSQTGQVILDLLRRLNRERQLTVVMVTHSAFAAATGTRTVELRDGRVARDVERRGGDYPRVVPLPER
jgi:putative ABC transport system ATP-binding protein